MWSEGLGLRGGQFSMGLRRRGLQRGRDEIKYLESRVSKRNKLPNVMESGRICMYDFMPGVYIGPEPLK